MAARSQSPDPVTATSSLRVRIHAECGAAYAAPLRRQIRRVHRLLNPPLNHLSIALVGDRRMSDLHLRFLSIAGPTDVLTFPLETDDQGHTSDGEVVICFPEARRRARATRTPLAHELLLYAIHGLLHLSGYDDRTARAFKIMHRKEDDLLTQLGIGPVFAPNRPIASATAGLLTKGNGR
jgi:probable rRNA maturation factor